MVKGLAMVSPIVGDSKDEETEEKVSGEESGSSKDLSQQFEPVGSSSADDETDPDD